MKAVSRVAAVLLVAACGGDPGGERPAEEDVQQEQSAAPRTPPELANPDTSGAGDARPFNLVAMNNSGVVGEANVAPRGNQTQVIVQLESAPASVSMQAHVHSGTCASGGPVVADLEPVNTDAGGTGVSTSVVSLAPETMFNGQHFVEVHGPGGGSDAAVACADIPPNTM